MAYLSLALHGPPPPGACGCPPLRPLGTTGLGLIVHRHAPPPLATPAAIHGRRGWRHAAARERQSSALPPTATTPSRSAEVSSARVVGGGGVTDERRVRREHGKGTPNRTTGAHQTPMWCVAAPLGAMPGAEAMGAKHGIQAGHGVSHGPALPLASFLVALIRRAPGPPPAHLHGRRRRPALEQDPGRFPRGSRRAAQPGPSDTHRAARGRRGGGDESIWRVALLRRQAVRPRGGERGRSAAEACVG